MNAAASLSSLCCSFIDLLSLAGKDTPEDKTQKLLCVLINIPLCVWHFLLYLERRHWH